ncbi:acylphosphatase [Amphibacillus sediminis]|uniref:acylphosphatase n=1 Tax=Amphibacillus sediminis TaxID=360185 RepID=UPI0008338A08|nr:acylphosphatase [Amphibacillus sediminis]
MADNINSNWGVKITEEIANEAKGLDLDAYLIALEGWRRGLDLRWHAMDHEIFKDMKTWFTDKPGKLFSLSSDRKTHYFFRTRGHIISNEAVGIASDKALSKQYLIQKGVNCIQGYHFDATSSIEEITEHAAKLGYPVVLKPADGSFGRDVYLNLNDQESLIQAFNQIKEIKPKSSLLLERHQQGQDYRVYVIADSVVAAIKRIPANVIGDGKHTIKELIERKNEERKKNPRLASCLIEINHSLKRFISDQGFQLTDIPVTDQQIFLNDKANISLGGDSIDVLDQLDEDAKKTAIAAIEAIPGLYHGSVDLLKTEDQAAVVIEINPTSQLGSLIFPMQGQGRDVPSALIDYYFPESIENKDNRSSMYFDFYDVLDPLNNGVVKAIKVSTPLLGRVFGKRYVVSGDVNQIGFHRGLRKFAFENKISGYINRLETDRIEIILVASTQDKVDSFKEAIYADSERSSVSSVVEEPWSGSVKVGFEIKVDVKMQLERISEVKDEIKQVELEIKQMQKAINSFYHSLSWKLTAPLRIPGLIAKKIQGK